MANLLVVDDEKSLCEMLDITFRKDGHRIETVTALEQARKKLTSNIYDVIISDIRLPEGSGLDVLRLARETDEEAKVILMTAAASLESAIEAVKTGAFDYILKTPSLVDELRLAVSRAVELRVIRQENRSMRRQLKRGLESLLGQSAAMKALKELIATVAATGSNILITGESGTGKELVARAMHACSPRLEGPFVPVNCGAFPETLLESELFGYVKGAFTGATSNRQGLFESANGGTLFLDEIGDMSLAMQVKLLRALQERTVRPLGGAMEVPVDVRLITATNRNLQRAVGEKNFREDLYYRISVIPVEIPPLRARSEDIPLLATHFLNEFSKKMGKHLTGLGREALSLLENYSWPGNVRELENTIERAVALEKGEEITLRSLPDKLSGPVLPAPERTEPLVPAEGVKFEERVGATERAYLQAALQQAGGVRTRAAELLGMSYRSFRHYAKKYGL
jgi:two-component system response regulator PilR (NtrC family)